METRKDYKSEIYEKTEMIRLVTDFMLQGKISLQEARAQLSNLVEASRPMVQKAEKEEMAARLKKSEPWAEQFRLQSLYCGFLPMPYNQTYLNAPMKAIIAVYQTAKSQLLELDLLEEDNPSVEDWHCQYQVLEQTLLMLQKLINPALPFLVVLDIPAAIGQDQAVQRAEGSNHENIQNLLSILTNGEPYEFLVAHRQWMQKESAYLDYVENVLLPMMLVNITGQTQYMEEARVETPMECPEKPAHLSTKAIFGDSKIMDLISANQKLGEGFFKMDPQLEGLKGSLGMEMLKEATVEMLAKSLGIATEELIERIQKTITA